ncbi:hypothetical protein [Cyclobacterium marinum]|uniref:Uncharacterized protein n=1 Tax=Cyclobacterium marinum (strain ATCC 25205 / DSM 745 / LMG 13164 / NCIMB 1802) TaxID=880070 RepID=G0J0F3_CYCMS|nr:hypothetical protein [Cyclobacterium marinum]AEL23869.1 hypothetical protein Cycma_0084 [Cyclobacterium marinum DSM 745]
MMVEKYVLTSSAFRGNVVFGFCDGFLVYFNNESEMNTLQTKWLLTNLPFTRENLEAIKPIIKGKIEVIPHDLSFASFWDAYNKKVNKKRCEPLWNKLSEADKITCLMSIKSYDGYLRRMGGRAKLDPENYLKRESYHNPWNQLTS